MVFFVIFLLPYMEDMLIVANQLYHISKLILLKKEFAMKDLCATTKILRMIIRMNKSAKKLQLSHKIYVEKILYIFDTSNLKAMSTPLTSHFKLSLDQCPKT